MRLNLTQEDSRGTVFLRSWALPLIVAALCVPIIGLMLLSLLAIEGTALGLAAGAIAVATLIVIVSRIKPRGSVEIAARRDRAHRVLVLATAELGASEAERVASEIEDADDVRVLVPARIRSLDRWLSATDDARDQAQGALARSAGALVAAGLPVSGSLGDSDPAQALEDELRSYPADRVIVVGDDSGPDPLSGAGERLDVPLTRVLARMGAPRVDSGESV
jgi:hypothetical protein